MAKTTKEIRAHSDAELNQEQLRELAGRLTDMRLELVERVEQLELQMVTRDDCSHADAADAASAQESRIRARGMVEQHREIIREIDAAARRLENGNYGISETTGEPIGYDRLNLVPWARTGTDSTKT